MSCCIPNNRSARQLFPLISTQLRSYSAAGASSRLPTGTTPRAPQPSSPAPLSLSGNLLHCYWDTNPPTPQQLHYADHFFNASTPEFLFSAVNFRSFPLSSTPEVAFLGRSNVGKSSLLNALLGRTTQKLAHVSSKPGRTRSMNAFGVGGGGGGTRDKKDRGGRVIKGGEGERWIGRGGVVIVDMPGYGKGSRREWGEEITKYLIGRQQLRRTYLLVDAEHGLKPADAQLLSTLRGHGIQHQIILSKADKILYPSPRTPAPEQLQQNLLKLRAICDGIREQVQPKDERGPKALGEIICCSAEKSVERGKKLGMDSVRWAVLSATGLDSDASGKKRSFDMDDYTGFPLTNSRADALVP
ncbi:hypothetical protein B0A49_13735 [Cryomyces minteri]|uniref:GTP-binding protein 8 n=1 Tax=Cryomyces minteri TaxID=331657 RepID=A0A4U0XF07_9PEZI|nr:hypothetical protein B0A49_13735 [Cryomyces minteri]